MLIWATTHNIVLVATILVSGAILMALKGAFLDLDSATAVLGSEYGYRQVPLPELHAAVGAAADVNRPDNAA
jgi:hypothetical protein